MPTNSRPDAAAPKAPRPAQTSSPESVSKPHRPIPTGWTLEDFGWNPWFAQREAHHLYPGSVIGRVATAYPKQVEVFVADGLLTARVRPAGVPTSQSP